MAFNHEDAMHGDSRASSQLDRANKSDANLLSQDISNFIGCRKLALTNDINSMNRTMGKLVAEVELLKAITDANQSDSDGLVFQMCKMSNRMKKLRNSLDKIFVVHTTLTPSEVMSLLELMKTLQGGNYKLTKVSMSQSNVAMRALGVRVESLTNSMEVAQRETGKLEKSANTIIQQIDSLQKSHDKIITLHKIPPSSLLKRLTESVDLLETTSLEASKQMSWVNETTTKLISEVICLGKSSKNVHNGMVALSTDVTNIIEQMDVAQKAVDVLLGSALTSMAQTPWATI